jgi:hypothetical protein
MKQAPAITRALAAVALGEANLTETRLDLDGLLDYCNSPKFSGSNGHVAVEDIILRVREIQTAMLFRENPSEYIGLACSLDRPYEPATRVEEEYPDQSSKCRTCGDELRRWYIAQTGYCTRHAFDRRLP